MTNQSTDSERAVPLALAEPYGARQGLAGSPG